MVKNLALIAICMFFITISSYGQKIDSLKSLLSRKAGSERANILLELAWEYFDTNNSNLASRCRKEAHKIAEDWGDSLMITKTGRLTASILRRIGEIDSAILIYEKILPIIQRNGYADMLLRVLNGLALSYNDKAQYDKALQYNLKSLEAARRIKDATWINASLNNIGLVYYKLKDYQKALSYFKQSIQLKRKLGVGQDLDMMLVNAGLCYAYLEDFLNAKVYIDDALKTCKGSCNDYMLVNAHFAMGIIYFGLKESNNAERYFLKSYLSAERIHSIRIQFDNIDYLSQIYIQQNRADLAISYLNKAEKLINQGAHYNLEMIKIYSRYSQIYSKTKNFEMASFYQLKYIQLKDSIYNEDLTTNLMKLESDFQEQENQAKIASQNEVLFLKEQVIRRQNLLSVAISAITIILMFWL